MTQPVVTVTRRLPAAVQQRLAESFDVRLNRSDRVFARDQLFDAFQQSDALLCTVSDAIDRELIEDAQRRATIIANFGVGYDNIDIEAAREQGVVVTNTPDVLTEATADIACLLLLSVTRGASAAEARLRRGDWQGFTLADDLGMSIQGKTLGIVGMGRIGQAVARRAALAFGMRVIYFNRSPVPALDVPVESRATLEAVLAEADLVSLHVPSSSDGPLLDAATLAVMKPTAYLINTSRGDVVDEAALIELLQRGRLAGVGLDVYQNEPKVSPQLLALENTTLLPHIGSATREVRDAMGNLAIDNLVAHFAGKPYPSRIV